MAKRKPDSTFERRWKGQTVTSEATYRKIQNAITEYDRVISDYESRWGADRLPNIISMDMREKYWAQMDRLNSAIDSNNPIDVEHHVKVTIKAYASMEAKAKEMGYKELTGIAWTARSHDDKTTIAIVQDVHEIGRVKKEMPDANVYSVSEIANILNNWQDKSDIINQVKDMFPGAHVSKVTPLEKELDDEIPF